MNYLIIFFLVAFFMHGTFAKFIDSHDDDTNRDYPIKKWWENANFYQLYPRSFKDSGDDGIGDLKGMIANLDHLKDLGITATWLSPIFASPQKDLGYDVSDFYTIDPSYGDMKDFEKLIERAHSLGIKLMLDFIPNHTSDQHKWFIDSVNKNGSTNDWYVWRDGNETHPPNNWVSVMGGPAWTYRKERGQWYLHQFTKYQPDLNYRNKEVKAEMTKVLEYYLKKGVDGFRLDAINHMYEDLQFRDEPLSGWTEDPNSYDYLEHIYTKDLDDTYDVVYEWRDYLEKYVNDNNLTEDKILMTEAYANITNTMRYYLSTDGKRKGAHMPFNFELIYAFENDTTAPRIKNGIDQWLTNMPKGGNFTPSWVIGSHDHSRVATRIGSNRIELANVILMTLPGTSITYYGEEIGMTDNEDFEIVVDHRDRNRTPMQWDNTTNAGFTKGKTTWLPVHKNYLTVNVEHAISKDDSIFNQYIKLAELRKHPTMIHGNINSSALNNDILAFTREFEDHDTYVTVANIGGSKLTANLTGFLNVPEKLHVVFVTSGSDHKIGDTVDSNNVVLQKYEAIVLRSDASLMIKLSTGLLILVLLKVLFEN